MFIELDKLTEADIGKRFYSVGGETTKFELLKGSYTGPAEGGALWYFTAPNGIKWCLGRHPVTRNFWLAQKWHLKCVTLNRVVPPESCS